MVGPRSVQRPLALTIVTGIVVQGVSAGLQQGLGSIAPALREQAQTSPAELSVLIASIGLGVTCAVLAGGVLADRFGERAVVVGGLSLCTVALIFASQQRAFAGLLACLLFVGLGLGGPNGATGKALATRAGPHRLGLALGLRQMAVPLGTAGGVLRASPRCRPTRRSAAVGWISDRIPHRRSALLAGCGALPGALSLAAGLAAGAGSPWVVPLLVVAAVASMSWNGLPFIVAAAACPPERLGSVHGVLSTVLFGLGAVAALVVGMMRAVSTWPATWMSLSLFTLVGLFFVWRGLIHQPGRT